MAFNPEPEYHIEAKAINIRHFHAFEERYIVRPPYQRKSVWDTAKKQALLDSLFRRYYIPSIVIREVRLDKQNSRREVIDGQQRISTAQEFYDNKLKLPGSLVDVDTRLPGKHYDELHVDIREFIDEELHFNAEIIKNIQYPDNYRHLKIASEIFWRLQQGESLNKIETAHARLSSPVRNFLVKNADDYDFDFETYGEIDPNPHKHIFFKETYGKTNSRMQHLALLGRFLLLERAGGPADIGNAVIAKLIDDTVIKDDGIGDLSFENKREARATLKTLNRLREVFRDDPKLDPKWGVYWLFRHEYFTVSCYLLLRHLLQNFVYSNELRICYREFVYQFFGRTMQVQARDDNARTFVEYNQQNSANIEVRDRIIRVEFFEFAEQKSKTIFLEKDRQRAFSEAQRIKIYLRDDGLCQQCLKDGLAEDKARVSWSQYEADHVQPHAKGGATELWNGQVLCREHNRQKGAAT